MSDMNFDLSREAEVVRKMVRKMYEAEMNERACEKMNIFEKIVGEPNQRKEGRGRMSKREQILEQARFCQAMLNRIAEDIRLADYGECYIDGHTRIQSDIIHARRELMRLSEMIGGMRR